MAIYSLSLACPGSPISSVNSAAVAEIIATATDAPRILEIVWTTATTSAQSIAVGRPAAGGVLAQRPFAFAPDDANDLPATVKIAGPTPNATGWATPPTLPANFFRRATVQNVFGSNIRWKFRDGLVIPAGGSIVFWVFSGNPIGNLNVVISV